MSIWRRNTKQLAGRIDRGYVRRFSSFRGALRFITLAFLVTSLAWLGWFAFARNSTPYSAGPIRSEHAVFSQNCGACHASGNGFALKTADAKCKGCHDGPIHQARQISTPTCGSCHAEHKGSADLSRVNSQNCAACHSNLKTTTGEVRFQAHIDSFREGHHPEFAVWRNSVLDKGTVAFNHWKHLRPQLRNYDGAIVTLACSDCHRGNASGLASIPASNKSWPYGTLGDFASGEVPVVSQVRHVSSDAYMGPINYYEHCSKCHPLAVDSIAEPVPHRKPEVVEAFLRDRLSRYIDSHPEALWSPATIQARIAERPPVAMPRTKQDWIQAGLTKAHVELWGGAKGCRECHAFTANGSALPVIQKAQIALRWFDNARFDHRAHQSVQCESCHEGTRISEKTSDVLIPKIKSCEGCHRPNETAAARAECSECHDYHDWTKERRIDGRYSIQQLTTELRPTSSVSAR